MLYVVFIEKSWFIWKLDVVLIFWKILGEVKIVVLWKISLVTEMCLECIYIKVNGRYKVKKRLLNNYSKDVYICQLLPLINTFDIERVNDMAIWFMLYTYNWFYFFLLTWITSDWLIEWLFVYGILEKIATKLKVSCFEPSVKWSCFTENILIQLMLPNLIILKLIIRWGGGGFIHIRLWVGDRVWVLCHSFFYFYLCFCLLVSLVLSLF